MFKHATTPPDSTAGSLYIVFQKGLLVTDIRSSNPCLIPQEQFLAQRWDTARSQFIGYWHSQPCFGVEISPAALVDPMRYQSGSLYQLLGRVDDSMFALVGRASQLLAWERDHRFCGHCGDPMSLHPDENAMFCTQCGGLYFPRIAPCIIVLVARGEEMLLARSPNFPVPMYSTLAGFIEAGESAEQTLVREVKEEVNIEVDNIRYFGSQSWPFPGQLMLGYFAEYAAGDIICDPEEIADAQWFHHTKLPTIPPRASISGQLIHAHIESLR